MVKAIVTTQFTLKDFKYLKNLVRANAQKNTEGTLFIGDTFECTEKMADYLTGGNAQKKVVVKVIEIIPEIKKEVKPEVEAEITTEKKPKRGRKKKAEEEHD